METIIRIDGAYAPDTIRAYKSNFERFIEFCDEEKTTALPANHEKVSSYIKNLSKGKPEINKYSYRYCINLSYTSIK